MNKYLLLFFITISTFGYSQDIFGKWKTVNNNDESRCIIEIYEDNGKVYGTIVEILDPKFKDAICTKCEDDAKDKPVLGFQIIRDMEKDGAYYRNGTIFDPEFGKEYRCRMKLTSDSDILQIRGYISFMYSTQYWERVKA